MSLHNSIYVNRKQLNFKGVSEWIFLFLCIFKYMGKYMIDTLVRSKK